MARKVQLSF
nr:unnamed protein product [Callosobruchus analis]